MKKEADGTEQLKKGMTIFFGVGGAF